MAVKTKIGSFELSARTKGIPSWIDNLLAKA